MIPLTELIHWAETTEHTLSDIPISECEVVIDAKYFVENTLSVIKSKCTPQKIPAWVKPDIERLYNYMVIIKDINQTNNDIRFTL